MKKNWVKWLVIAASIVTILASTTSAVASVKGLFGKKNDDTKQNDDSTNTAAVLIDESLTA